jgi:hypothetical protein
LAMTGSDRLRTIGTRHNDVPDRAAYRGRLTLRYPFRNDCPNRMIDNRPTARFSLDKPGGRFCMLEGRTSSCRSHGSTTFVARPQETMWT